MRNRKSHQNSRNSRAEALRLLKFNDVDKNVDLWDSKSRTWEKTFEVGKTQLQRFVVSKISKLLFSRSRALHTYTLSKFHWLATLVHFSHLFEKHLLFIFQKTEMLQNFNKAVWNPPLQSLKTFEAIINYMYK